MNKIQQELYNYLTDMGFSKKYSHKIILSKEGYLDADIDNIKSIPDLITFMINYTRDNILFTAKDILSKDQNNMKPINSIEQG